MTESHRLNFLLPEELFQELNDVAKSQDLNVAQLLRKLIKAEVKKNT